MASETGALLRCRVELFGMARLAGGRREVPLELRHGATLRDVIEALAKAAPALVGKAIDEDRSGLMRGHILNLNGASFVGRLDVEVSSGDSVLLLSDQAGG